MSHIIIMVSEVLEKILQSLDKIEDQFVSGKKCESKFSSR